MLSNDNPMLRVLMTTLFFEVVVFGLSVAVMVMLDGTRPAIAGTLAGGAALLALVAGATFKRPFGQPLGWAAQVAGLALGIVTPIMFVVGGVFAGLYVAGFVLGRRLEPARTA
ncbi:Protein of unknown function [Raineyella antarctica]|uniref:DUF4233 domain-containing protein n=1 Tax=Raineyella antarctica TaxID=1577474 RepID=A0A1G6H1H0_9ACTN|nr:DUF4233 domain-containing protein [Raineyella antarctica]SDB88160.1 Protein of unknown function [Raineyella antarctica]